MARTKKGRQGGKKISNKETLPEIPNKMTPPEISNKETLPELPDTYDDINCPLHEYLKCMVAAPIPGQLVKVLVKGEAIVKKGQPLFVMNVGVYLKLPSTTDSEEVKEEDMWVPGTSNMLQLLVSIQKKISCANPLSCDVRVAKHTSLYAKHSVVIYRENTFIKLLKTMEYIINNPPKNFEDFVVGHFRNHATDILLACKEEASKESCTTTLKRYLDLCFNLLVVAFIKIGAKLPQDFLPLVEKRSLQFA